VVVQKVEVPAGKTIDFGQSVVHRLRVESASTGKERLLVAEIANVRATSRDHNGIWDQIEVPLDQIAADRGKSPQASGLWSHSEEQVCRPGNHEENGARCPLQDR
jgi:hypothetical protein